MEEPIVKQHTEEQEMSFIDHLEELRWHLVRSIVAILIFAIAAFAAKSFIFDQIIFGPAQPEFITFKLLCALSTKIGVGNAFCIKDFNFEFINVEMAGQFLVHLKVALILGFIVAFPYVFWEFWRFVKPALYSSEVRYTRGIIFFSSLLFIIGVTFGYYLLCPFSINFFANYGVSELVGNSFKLTSYVAFISMLVLASGILFELPMVVYFLSKVGLLTPQFMREHRKHAFILTLVIAAIITPADVGTQVMVTIPVIFLYEISIFISKRVNDGIAKDFN